jgi:hypothetical protein
VNLRRVFLLSASLLAASFSLFTANAQTSTPHRFVVDRSRLPEALQQVPLEHLSSGALMLLDRGGDLVQPPPLRSNILRSIIEPSIVALDPRVGANIRLGDDPPALGGLRAQAEPSIARSPINSNFLVGTFQEGRFTDGGAVDCGYSISTDGGQTWTRALIPNLTQTSGGTYFRATDPVAGVDLNGNTYLLTEAATDELFRHGVVLLSRSNDGGQTFGMPSVIYHPASGSGLFPDKPWMAIDTFAGTPTAGRILATFTLFSNLTANGGSIERAYSDDGGVTWTTASIANSGAKPAQGSQPVFLPNGNAVIVYWNFGSSTSPGERLEAVISSDGGATFGSPKLITAATEYNEPSIRTGGFLPAAVADRTVGNLYVVYQTRLAGNPKIAFAKSTNGGKNWSAPIAITDNPSGDGVFNPAIAVSPDGQTVVVVFYDHRNHVGSATLVDLYLAQSFDGGATWEPNIQVSSASSDASLAPLTDQGYMLGDYQGLAEPTNANVPAVPLWIDTRTGNPDPFVARVQITPSQGGSPTPTPTPTATPTPTPTATPTPSPTPLTTPVVSVSAAPTAVDEGATATYTISASTINPVQVTTVHYTMSGKGRLGVDYTLSGPAGQADIPAGVSSTTVTLTALTNGVPGRPKKVTMKLTAGANYKLAKTKKAVITILDHLPFRDRR